MKLKSFSCLKIVIDCLFPVFKIVPVHLWELFFDHGVALLGQPGVCVGNFRLGGSIRNIFITPDSYPQQSFRSENRILDEPLLGGVFRYDPNSLLFAVSMGG